MTNDISTVTLRAVKSADAARILDIYAPYISNTSISFETTVPSLEAFTQRIADIVAHYPYLVAEKNGIVIGYAYATRIRGRAAYDWSASLSVYLDHAYTGRGVGSLLCRALFALLREQGIRSVFSLVSVPNEPSVALHKSLGFSFMGTQEKAGFKAGEWHDVVWFQKPIGDFSGAPDPTIPFPDLDPSLVKRILSEAQ